MSQQPADPALGQGAALMAATRRFIRETVLPVQDAYDGDVTAAEGSRT